KTPAAAGIRPQTTQSISGTAMRHTARDLLGDTRLDTVSTLVMAGIDCANYFKETASNSTRFGRLGESGQERGCPVKMDEHRSARFHFEDSALGQHEDSDEPQ